MGRKELEGVKVSKNDMVGRKVSNASSFLSMKFGKKKVVKENLFGTNVDYNL